MEQTINYGAFRPMDIVFWTSKKFWGKARVNVGIIVAIFEDLFIIEVGEETLSLRHIEEVNIAMGKRSWAFDMPNATYTAQSILINDLGREKVGDNSSQYTVSRAMVSKDSIANYINIVFALSNADLGSGVITVKRLMSTTLNLNDVHFKQGR